MTCEDTPWHVDDAADLLRRMATLHLASVSSRGEPLASVAPFVVVVDSLYVFLSALAPHTANLREPGRVSLLLARDESDCTDAFARPRLTLQCESVEVPRGSPAWAPALDAMESRHGETAAVVRELADFALFRLTPREGQVVSGFARAKRLDGQALGAVFRAIAPGPAS